MTTKRQNAKRISMYNRTGSFFCNCLDYNSHSGCCNCGVSLQSSFGVVGTHCSTGRDVCGVVDPQGGSSGVCLAAEQGGGRKRARRFRRSSHSELCQDDTYVKDTMDLTSASDRLTFVGDIGNSIPNVFSREIPTVVGCNPMSSSHDIQRELADNRHIGSSSSAEDVPPEYIDIGDCSYRCTYCDATFWYGERLKSSSSSSSPTYHGCCVGGKIHLSSEVDAPAQYRTLLQQKCFVDNIRAYNQMFAMTSFGARIDDNINNVHAPYVFKLSGQVYHWIGSLCPTDGDPPRFLQLYIHDTHNEIDNRLAHFSSSTTDSDLDKDIVRQLMNILDMHNSLVRLFRTARDKCLDVDIPDFKIKLYNVPGARGYELPTYVSVGAIVFDSGPSTATDYDVIIEVKGGLPQRINKLHPCYMALQFPLLFLYGQEGYHTGLKAKTSARGTRLKRMTMNDYYGYQLHERHNIRFWLTVLVLHFTFFMLFILSKVLD